MDSSSMGSERLEALPPWPRTKGVLSPSPRGQRLLEAVVVLGEVPDELVEGGIDEELGDVALHLRAVEI